MDMPRMSFENDEDGHWYLIPINKMKLFEQLLYDEDDTECEKFNEEFGALILSMHISNYSFVDVREIDSGKEVKCGEVKKNKDTGMETNLEPWERYI